MRAWDTCHASFAAGECLHTKAQGLKLCPGASSWRAAPVLRGPRASCAAGWVWPHPPLGGGRESDPGGKAPSVEHVPRRHRKHQAPARRVQTLCACVRCSGFHAPHLSNACARIYSTSTASSPGLKSAVELPAICSTRQGASGCSVRPP